MGHSKVQKAESHERIVVAAVRCFREHGVEGISVADVMQEAGLTPGGFYRHFDSREDLIAAAVERALADGSAAIDALAASRDVSMSVLVDAYLSLVHRDNVGSGCVEWPATSRAVIPAPAKPIRARWRSTCRSWPVLMATIPQRQRLAAALSSLSMLVGAVSMARAVNDEKLSREILNSAATALKARLA